MRPPCFDSQEQFDAWVQTAMEVESRNLVPFCEDCTPDYKAAMLKQGRCIRPDSGFREDEDGFVAGYVPLRPSAMAKQLMEKAYGNASLAARGRQEPQGGVERQGASFSQGAGDEPQAAGTEAQD